MYKVLNLDTDPRVCAAAVSVLGDFARPVFVFVPVWQRELNLSCQQFGNKRSAACEARLTAAPLQHTKQLLPGFIPSQIQTLVTMLLPPGVWRRVQRDV